MNNPKSSNLIRYFFELGKMLVVYIVIFQMFTQPIAVLAQSKAVLEVPRAQTAAKSNIKPKAEEDDNEGFLPNFEKQARKAVSDAFGFNIPLPQVFGENGKLQSLFAGGASSADKNKELIDAALNNGKTGNSKLRTKLEKTLTETAVSLNAPVLKSGTIQGSLRVSKEVPFNLDGNFRITENLYTAGSPNITTRQNSEIQNIVNEEGDDLSKNYPLFLNGGRVDGNIYIHSAAENLFKDIPLGLPKPTGSETIEINSAGDLKNIKDWKSVKT